MKSGDFMNDEELLNDFDTTDFVETIDYTNLLENIIYNQEILINRFEISIVLLIFIACISLFNLIIRRIK